MYRRLLFLALISCLAASAFGAEPAIVRFESDVRPILKANCFQCHGDEAEPQGKLDMRLARWLLRGGESGPAVVPGKPSESLLYQRALAGEMPPGDKKLSAAALATLAAWIEQGAQTLQPEPESLSADAQRPDAQWTEVERAFWSFQDVRRPPVPAVARPDFVRTPVDAFLLAELERLEYSPPADRATLVRRLYFDLTGLPPPYSRVQAFVADESPDAYERLVDELLASPAYGERWARHWLDVAGYADSDGYTEQDPERPWAWRYRDYVIRSLNADKSFDQFVIEQLAGDELLAPPYVPPAPGTHESSEWADKLIATGFLRMAPDGTGGGGVDANVARNDVLAETVKIVTTSLLGLSVGCAQCHNHRYDPISQRDYYRLRAIFEPALDWKNWRPPGARLVSLWTAADVEQAAKADAELTEAQNRRAAELNAIVEEIFQKELAKLDEPLREPARLARTTPAAQRTPEQVQILKDHPSLNVDGGSAYLYEPQRLQEFNQRHDKLAAETRAKRPPDNYVACLRDPLESTCRHASLSIL